MLPLRDRNPSGIVPWATYAFIAANVVAFVFQSARPKTELTEFVLQYGLVPSRVTGALKGEVAFLGGALVPAFSSMFLHGDILHLLGNMWFLWIFGDNVEGRLGHLLYVPFYLACGLAAAALQYVIAPSSPVPMIGASGAIGGVLGAYIVCWPGARVLTLVPFFYFLHFVEVPAMVLLGIWFLFQFLEGAASLGVASQGGVAYWAHIGGFAAGVLLVKLLPDGSPHRAATQAPWRR
ncbi:MAG: rhomboid family intramembrane serine protease [Candidatus Brocadiaceae bacterium]|nr:rhomboid family intramembrane serine protease [Candidatus Brocadiaceae bacterium]